MVRHTYAQLLENAATAVLFLLIGWAFFIPRSESQNTHRLAQESVTFFQFEAHADGTGTFPPYVGETTADAEIGLDTVTNTLDVSVRIEGERKSNIVAIEIHRDVDPLLALGDQITLGLSDIPNGVILSLDIDKIEEDFDEETGEVRLDLDAAMVPFPEDAVEELLNGELHIRVRFINFFYIHGNLLEAVDVPGEFDLTGLPKPLGSLPPPEADLKEFVKDEQALLQLGKVLFWDVQVGSDGRVACATCHFHAGADVRDKNSIGVPPNPPEGLDPRLNLRAREHWFPFHKLADPTDRDFVVADTAEVFGSQGVQARNFIAIRKGRRVDSGRGDFDRNVFGDLRQVEPRQAPTVVNAVFKDRLFWDGRANRFFNGENPFGDTDPDARVWYNDRTQGLIRRQILVDNSALASQAVGPPLSDFEMSWRGRRFPEIGRKLISLPPLAVQVVSTGDSVLGPLAKPTGRGLQDNVTYRSLIKAAFKNRWWNHVGLVDGEFTQMEANFAMFWGMAIYEYESTLIDGDTRFDRFAADWHGDLSTLEDDGIIDDTANDLTDQEKEGAELFLKQGRCVECHEGPTFTTAAVHLARLEPIEEMALEHVSSNAFYDSGFYNIGVRPAAEDPGIGGSGPFGPFSLTRRRQLGLPIHQAADDPELPEVPADAHVATDGAQQVPTLRNVELTGPYMHNGGMSTLEQVIEFYARGTDFFDEDVNQDLDPDVGGIGKVRGNQERIDAMVAFLKTLTDERVRYRKAPFDHPQITVVNGRLSDGRDRSVRIKEVGAGGGAPLKSFAEILQSGGFRAP